MISLWWFALGWVAAHIFWTVVCVFWWYKLTKGTDKLTQAVNEDFQDVRNAIRRRRAPLN
jgi:hypothetical protein